MNSCRKGADGERELAALLRNYGYRVQRGGTCSFGEVPDVFGLPGVHVECKRVEKLNLSAAMAQSVRDSERFGDGIPTVFHRKPRKAACNNAIIRLYATLHESKRQREGVQH